MTRKKIRCTLAARLGTFTVLGFGVLSAALAQTTLLNVSYDVTRELYKDINPAFAAAYKAQAGADVTVNRFARRFVEAGTVGSRGPGG